MFDALWVLRRDVPDAEVAAVVDADMQALTTAWRERSPPLSFKSARARYRDLLVDNAATPHCGNAGSDCLEKVGASLDAYAALVQSNRHLIERVQALRSYDHYLSRLPPDSTGLLSVPVGLLSWPVTAHAVQFAKGDRIGAIDATCRDLATWRRIGHNSDELIVRTYGMALTTNGYGALLASMLADMPAGTALPGSCHAALVAPVAAEWSSCPAMRGAFATSMDVVQQIPEMREHNAWSWLVLDRDASRALFAEQMSVPCAAQPLPDTGPQVSSASRPIWRRFECIANFGGCVIANVGGPTYQPLAARGHDYGARLQLLGTLAWLREQPDDGSLAERLARRPEGLRSADRDITIGADGRTIGIAQRYTSPVDTWSLPLPAYLVEAVASAD
ncbi:hypothetical protein [Luteimonas chenhongjianii]|uniref:hypothetical protein n=1 Tax=Luteimonas chenhongjianii TaxID=2006110 RepID=UPI0012FDCB35|nr:hypothetical protein [Luteimonas chenhongjianii]